MIPPMRAAPLLALLLLAACASPADRDVHLAVKGLVESKDSLVKYHMARVVGLGRPALLEIEQQFQGASTTERLRLLEALEFIGEPEALPLVRHVARWEQDRVIREAAQGVVKALARR